MTITLERKAQLLDTILETLVYSHPDLGGLLMIISKEDYCWEKSEVLVGRRASAALDNDDFMEEAIREFASRASKEELRALLLPFIPSALTRALGVEVSIAGVGGP